MSKLKILTALAFFASIYAFEGYDFPSRYLQLVQFSKSDSKHQQLTIQYRQKMFFNKDKNYKSDWQKVDSLEEKGLTESASKIVDEIYAKAKKDNNSEQIVKAVIYQAKYISLREEDADIKILNKLDSETTVAPYPAKPILHSILAERYWQYYEDNRWRFYNRSNTIQFTTEDIATWSINDIVNETVRQYHLSLQETDKLKATKIDIYHEILGGNADNTVESYGKHRNRNLRPTLYDFLAHRAVDFFSNSEPEITRPVYKFELDKAEYFASAKEFVALKIETKDTLEMKFHAIVLLQDLIKFHLSSKNQDALADADLKRINFVYEYSVHSQKEGLYLKALQDFQNTYEGSPIAADAAYLTANLYYEQGKKYDFSKNNDLYYRWKFKEAKEWAEKAIKKYPNTQGANNCQHIIELIQTKSFSLNVEKVSPAQTPQRALVTYRNVPKMYFKIVATDYEELSTMAGYYFDDEEQEKLIRRISQRKGIKSWNVNLPSDDGDFQAHATEMLVPELPYGYYFILASDHEDFTYKKHTLVWSHFVISDLSLVGRNWSEKGEQEFYVLNRTTGRGMPNVRVQTFYRDYNYNSRKYEYKKGAVYTSDKEGYVKLKYTGIGGQRNEYFNLELINSKDKLHINESFYLSSPYQNTPTPYYKTFFFTDRAIYRPSQTIYFKGILLNFKNKSDSLNKNITDFQSNRHLRPEIVKNQTLKVYFYDANEEKVSEIDVKTNEYGSFSGSFIAPMGVLNGEMTIQTDVLYGGNHSISVEEYKRPKFEVTFEPVKGSYKLGEKVKIEGKAKAYSGANIDNAQVKYRIVRKAKLPYWWRWWYPNFQVSPEMEIGNGTATTDKDGIFTVDFEAIPDLSLPKSSKPTFTYQVLADVTDLNGETHSGSLSISIGYTALEIESNIPNILDVESTNTNFQINSTNLSGEFEPAQGTYTLHALKTPEKVFRKRLWTKPDKFLLSKSDFYKYFPQDEYGEESNLYTWAKGEKISEGNFDTGKDKSLNLTNLKTGVYVLELTAMDKYGEEVKGLKYFTVYSSKAKTPVYDLTEWVKPLKTTYEVGETAQLCVATAYQNVPILYEIEIDGTVIKKEWLDFNNEQRILEIPVTEAMRGNFGVHLTFIQHGRVYKTEQVFAVPHTDKELEISFETFRNKLLPGQNEEWKIKIKGKKGDKVAAEMVATLYDASLDIFRANSFDFNILSYNSTVRYWNTYAFGLQGSDISALWNTYKYEIQQRTYDNLYLFGWDYVGTYDRSESGWNSESEFAMGFAVEDDESLIDEVEVMAWSGEEITFSRKKSRAKTEMAKKKALAEETTLDANVAVAKVMEQKPKAEPKLEDVKARTNFNETAFFMPHLETDAEGSVVIKFTIPESLTRWKMLGFAHSKDLKHGFIQNELVTQKDLMVVPNAPRFFRENDEMTFASKITNLSDKDLTGKAKIMFFDAITMKPIDADLFSHSPQATSIENIATQNISIASGQSTVVKWNIYIPDAKYQAITYRVVAQAGEFTDGEEMSLPVLTNRLMITETLPLPVRGGQTKEYELTSLVKNKSTTLKNHKLTLEFTSNPAWYAIQSLPYLMEYPYECAEQTFSRFYANSIASHVANSHPRIKNVFDAWSNTAQDASAFLSNLEKNQELKYLLLQETPWVMNAQNEQARKKQIAVFFDLNRMAGELGSALTKLEQMQTPNGGFPWFEGMPDSPWITQHIVAGMGHLDKLGVSVLRNSVSASNKINYGINSERTWRMIEKATLYLDERMREDYDNLIEYCKRYNLSLEEQKLSYNTVHYLYARSFFKDIALAERNKSAYNYFLEQAKKYRLGNGLYIDGMLALVLYRNGYEATAKDIVKSLKERSLNSDEMGMYWKNMMKGSYWWYEAPVETQALMIEVFSEVAKDEESVNDLKVWLLKQKQTQDWKTTKATAEACYALLLQGDNWLLSDELVEVTLGNIKVNPKAMDEVKIEAGTGYFKTSWSKEAITPTMGKVTVKKNDKGVAWGGLYWQYFEQLDKITPAETPLKLKKQLFVQENSPTGPVIKPVVEGTPLKVGDLVKVRIELRVDRAMEYVHMKDMRAAGFEPVNVISRYKYQEGLGYYETTKDAATNFFFEYLGQGTYIFEYDLRVSHAGDFSNGVTTIQCMYAPEFSSHSEGVRVKVKE